MTSPRRRVDVTADTQARLEVIYERVRRSFAENLITIDAATRHAASGALDETERRAAETAAHRLVGAAATVGFPEATAPARRLEEAFGHDDVGPDAARVLQAVALELRMILRADQRLCS